MIGDIILPKFFRVYLDLLDELLKFRVFGFLGKVEG